MDFQSEVWVGQDGDRREGRKKMCYADHSMVPLFLIGRERRRHRKNSGVIFTYTDVVESN